MKYLKKSRKVKKNIYKISVAQNKGLTTLKKVHYFSGLFYLYIVFIFLICYNSHLYTN